MNGRGLRAAWRSFAVGFMLAGLASPASAQNESVFTFANAMPAVEGELEVSRENVDARSGLAMRQRIYLAETEAFSLRTHVIDVGCARVPEDEAPHIVAYQYFPKAPKSFTVASMPDFFMEVHVRDEAGRIRVYEQVAGGAMADLTKRFEPVCRRL